MLELQQSLETVGSKKTILQQENGKPILALTLSFKMEKLFQAPFTAAHCRDKSFIQP